MITIMLKGGRLGNLLFQYAAGRHLAVKNKTTLRLNLSNNITRYDILARRVAKDLSNFRIEAIVQRPLLKVMYHGIRSCLGLTSVSNDRVYCEKHWGFDPNVLSLRDGACLNGHFQSEKYFKDSAQVIREDLRLRSSLCILL